MINKNITKLADKLQKDLLHQKKVIADNIDAIPEGKTKASLQRLSKLALSGKLNPDDAKRELDKVLKDARNH